MITPHLQLPGPLGDLLLSANWGRKGGAHSLREGEGASLSSWTTPSPLPPNSRKEWGGPNASEGTAA